MTDATDADMQKSLVHNDNAQLQRLLDSMGQESAAPEPQLKKSSKGAVSRFRALQKLQGGSVEPAEPRRPAKKSNKGAVSHRPGAVDTGPAVERPPRPPRKQEKKKRRREDAPRRAPPPLPSSEAVDALVAGMSSARPARPKKRPKPKKQAAPGADACAAAVDAFVTCRAAAMRGDVRPGAALEAAFDGVQGGTEAADARRAALDARRRVARAAPGLARRDAAALVDALTALDEAYHQLRYACREHVPPPHEVFEKLLGRGSIIDAAADAAAAALPEDFLGEASDDPLHRLYRLRWREGAWLFGPASPWSLDEKLEPGQMTTTPKRNDPVAAPTVHKWRDSARTWACREYAYAVPCDAALDVLKALGRPVVEAGAGTGYWAKALRARGVAVTAYDVRPPTTVANAYHGRQAAHVPDLRAGDALHAAEEAATQGAVLFACYAPPENDGAEAFLGAAAKHYADRGGDVLALVGEWRGDTAEADATFLKRWELVTQTPVPNWGDTSALLTIWRPTREAIPLCALDTCSACGVRRGLRRCRLTCDVVYCSRACAGDDAARRAALVAFKFADSSPPGADDFDDPLRFVAVGGGGARAKKKRLKKKGRNK